MKRALTLTALAALLALAAPGAASAAPELLWQVPVAGPASGSGAGQLFNPVGIAVDPSSGNVFVAERSNARISEFSPWGEFVKSFGWKVNASAPAEALQVCTTETGCQIGTEGSGKGQLGGVFGLAFGSGNLYAYDVNNRRVSVFTSAGSFVVMFGAEVNKTKVEAVAPEAQQNRCPVDPGDVCQAGVSGTGPGEFSSGDVGDYIDAGPGGSIYVGDVGRIQKFDALGNFTGEIKGEAAGGTIDALEVDEDGNSYVVVNTGNANDVQGPLLKLGPAGEKLQSYEVSNPRRALALADSGRLYLVNDPGGNSFGTVPLEPRIVEFDAAANKVLPSEEEEEAEKAEPPAAPFPFGQVFSPGFIDVAIFGLATSSACGIAGEDIFASYTNGAKSLLRAYGPNPDPTICPPPEEAPSITEQFATSVGEDAATVKARINSHFWPTTTYFVQYGTGRCSEDGCTEELPLPPGLPLNSESGLAVSTAGIFLPGLTADTTYHYRFVARTVFEGASGDTVEVRGVDGKVGIDGAEASFTTAGAVLPAKSDCANQQFRSGASTHLSDCRAYEMVSPLDKDGGDIVALQAPLTDLRARLSQSASSGERMTYSSLRAFADPRTSPWTSQYLSSRGAGGWSTEALSPGRGRALWSNPLFSFESEFKGFSEDLCRGYLRLEFEAEPVLDPDAVKGFPNLYQRNNCGSAPSYEALSTVAPPNQTVNDYSPELQGASADGRCEVFRAQDALTPEAPFLGKTGTVLYERCDGVLRLVAVLPNGSPAPGGTTAGSASTISVDESAIFYQHRVSLLQGAVSADGSRVYWTTPANGPGKLFLRLNADQDPTPSGACEEGEPQNACTIPVSAGSSARFWFGAEDGSRALFTEGEKLLEFALNTEGALPVGEVNLVAEGVKGLLGASADAKRAYFASTKQLVSGKGVAGQPNLYYRELGGAAVFIGTLTPTDVGPSLRKWTAISPEPAFRAARVTPDGLHATFMTPAPLTGFDNTDQDSGQPDAEVFVYSADTAKLICASCDPSGAAPIGRNLANEITEQWVAATIPTYDSDLYASRPLSDDGQRLFFNSFGPLLNRDTNGKADVYEWQSAASQKACEEAGAERYVPDSEGCLSLISSGESSFDSEFLDASASGRDAFFATAASLLPQDPGLIDVYDARSGGGFPAPPPPTPECEGQACQSPPGAPDDPTPASAGYEGAGNVVAPSVAKPRCAKGKARRKGRCVRRKHGGTQKHTDSQRATTNDRRTHR